MNPKVTGYAHSAILVLTGALARMALFILVSAGVFDSFPLPCQFQLVPSGCSLDSLGYGKYKQSTADWDTQ